MIALYKYSFSDFNGGEVKECKATQIKDGETVRALVERMGANHQMARTNERIEIRIDVSEIIDENINF